MRVIIALDRVTRKSLACQMCASVNLRVDGTVTLLPYKVQVVVIVEEYE